MEASGAGATFRVFLRLGQSNMAGNPQAQALDKTEGLRIRVLGFDDCTHTGRKKGRLGHGSAATPRVLERRARSRDDFAKTRLPKLPGGDAIGLVPRAIWNVHFDHVGQVELGKRYAAMNRSTRLVAGRGGSLGDPGQPEPPAARRPFGAAPWRTAPFPVDRLRDPGRCGRDAFEGDNARRRSQIATACQVVAVPL